MARRKPATVRQGHKTTTPAAPAQPPPDPSSAPTSPPAAAAIPESFGSLLEHVEGLIGHLSNSLDDVDPDRSHPGRTIALLGAFAQQASQAHELAASLQDSDDQHLAGHCCDAAVVLEDLATVMTDLAQHPPADVAPYINLALSAARQVAGELNSLPTEHNAPSPAAGEGGEDRV